MNSATTYVIYLHPISAVQPHIRWLDSRSVNEFARAISERACSSGLRQASFQCIACILPVQQAAGIAPDFGEAFAAQ